MKDKKGDETAPGVWDARTIALIDSIARQVRADIEQGRVPDIKLPVRNLDNVTYDRVKGWGRSLRKRP